MSISNIMDTFFVPSLVAYCVGAARCAGKFISEIAHEKNLKIINKALVDGSENSDGSASDVSTKDQELRQQDSKDLPIKKKNPLYDPQTEADRASQTILMRSLETNFPECTIIAEEEDSDVDYIDSSVLQSIKSDSDVLEKTSKFIPILEEKYGDLMPSDVTIWIDPLDGTSEFAKGERNHVTILIGIVDNRTGKPIAGIIDQPFWKSFPQPDNEYHYQHRTIWGIVGMGAYNLHDYSSTKSHPTVICTSKTHVDDIVLRTMKSLKADKTLHIPGAGYKSIQVLENNADAFVYPTKGSCKWDICAADAIFRSSNTGKLTDIFGNEYSYKPNVEIKNVNGVLASNNDRYTEFLNLIPQDVLESMK